MIFSRFRVEPLFLYLPDHSTKTFSADLTLTRSRIPTQNASAITSHGRLSPCPSSSNVWISRGSALLLLRHAIIRGYGERKSVRGAQAEGGEGRGGGGGGGKPAPDSVAGCCIPECALMHGLGYVNSHDSRRTTRRVKRLLAVSVISNNGAS